MSNPFKVGDRVRCAHNRNTPFHCDEDLTITMIVGEGVYVNNRPFQYSYDRFVLADLVYFTNLNRTLMSYREAKAECEARGGGTIYKKVAELSVETKTVKTWKEF